jgi:hypothetical protein
LRPCSLEPKEPKLLACWPPHGVAAGGFGVTQNSS